jgi:hypothetical protein
MHSEEAENKQTFHEKEIKVWNCDELKNLFGLLKGRKAAEKLEKMFQKSREARASRGQGNQKMNRGKRDQKMNRGKRDQKTTREGDDESDRSGGGGASGVRGGNVVFPESGFLEHLGFTPSASPHGSKLTPLHRIRSPAGSPAGGAVPIYLKGDALGRKVELGDDDQFESFQHVGEDGETIDYSFLVNDAVQESGGAAPPFRFPITMKFFNAKTIILATNIAESYFKNNFWPQHFGHQHCRIVFSAPQWAFRN